MRSGFTLIEALVALVLFEFGILALVASGSVIARDLAAANRRTRARTIATSRIERTRAVACASLGSGRVDVAGGITEYWRVDASGATRMVTDSVEYQLPAKRQSRIVMRGWVYCAP